MKTPIYIYGDSFADPQDDFGDTSHAWTNLLSEDYLVFNHSESGTGPENVETVLRNTSKTIPKYMNPGNDHVKPGSRAVVLLSSPDRHWLPDEQVSGFTQADQNIGYFEENGQTDYYWYSSEQGNRIPLHLSTQDPPPRKGWPYVRTQRDLSWLFGFKYHMMAPKKAQDHNAKVVLSMLYHFNIFEQVLVQFCFGEYKGFTLKDLKYYAPANTIIVPWNLANASEYDMDFSTTDDHIFQKEGRRYIDQRQCHMNEQNNRLYAKYIKLAFNNGSAPEEPKWEGVRNGWS